MTNPFGNADHTPFKGFGVELIFGRRPDDSIVEIGDVPSGLACDCVCPACDRRLVARKGKTAHHFAHYGAGSGCGLGMETNAHYLAKQVLERHKAFYLPAIRAWVGGETLERRKSSRFEFDSVRLEKRLSDMVPDVILTKQGHDLIVEVFVTHRCDDEKIAKIKACGISVVEVDLRRYRTSQDAKAIERAMLKEAPRAWLHNPKIEETEAILREQIAKKEQARAAAIRARATRLVRAARDARPSITDALKAERDRAIALGRKAQISGQRTAEDGFVVPPNMWKAALYVRMIDQAMKGHWAVSIDTGEAMELIKDCLAPGLDRPFYGNLAAEIAKVAPDFTPPDQAVEAYLRALTDAGVLRDLEGGYYRMRDREVERVRSHVDAEQNTARRRAEVRRRVVTLLGGLPLDERKGFDLEQWLRSRIRGFRIPLDTLAAEGGPEWTRFEGLLRAAERMVDGGGPCSDTLGLPLAREIARSARQQDILAEEEARLERERRDEEAAGRAAKLTSAARVLGDRTAAWLASIDRASGLSMQDLARRDEAGAASAQTALWRLADHLERQRRAELATTKRREDLRREALKVYDDQRATLFLNSSHPELGGRSPSAACEDDQGFRAALALVPAKRQRSRI